jgi:phosphonate transport system substrate-binding protein
VKKFIAASASTLLAAGAVAAGVAAIAPGASSAAATCPSNPINFGVEPYDTGPALEKAYASLATDLGEKLGCSVKLIIADSYVAEIDSMAAGHLQIGEFGPLGYVLAHNLADAQPVAVFGDKDGKPDTYTAGIWVPNSSSIHTLKELKGHTLALSSTTSTSGALYPIAALNDAGFHCSVPQASNGSCDGVSIKFTGGHPEDLLALTHGTVDAAEVNSQEESSAEAAHEFNPKDYREIWKSTAIINDPVTVYGKLGSAFAAKVQNALLSLSAKQLATVDTELGTANNGKMLKANNALYNQVRAVAKAVHLSVGEL